MAPRKAPRNVIPDQKPSPRATRLRPRRGVAQEVEQQAPTPAPSTKTSTRTTTRKPAAKSTAAPKATPKAGSKSYKVTKPRGKTAAKNRKTTTDDAPSEPLDTADPDDVATTEDAPTDAPADLVTTKTPSKSSKVAKTPAKTTAKTPSKARSSKKAKSFEPEQQFVRTTRRSVQQGWQSPLSDQAQTIIGLLPKNQTEQESTPLSIVNESNQHETDEKQNEWFTPRSPAPYASAQKSAQKSTEKSKNKCEHTVSSRLLDTPLPAFMPAPSLSSPYCPSSVSQIAGVQATPGRMAQTMSAVRRVHFGEAAPAGASKEVVFGSPEPKEAYNSSPASTPAKVSTPPRVDSPMLSAVPAPGDGSPALASSPPAAALFPPQSPYEYAPVPALPKADVVAVLDQLRELRDSGISQATFLDRASRMLGGRAVPMNVVAELMYDNVHGSAMSEPDDDDMSIGWSQVPEDNYIMSDSEADYSFLTATAGDEDELPESSLGQPDDDDEEAMSDGSDEATDGQDDEMDDDEVADAEAEAHADADAASAEGTPRPETPPEEHAAPTTPTSNYYLAGLFNTGKSIFKKINPFGSRTPAPAPTSPTVARSSRRPGPVTPRIKNADERHSLAEANKEKSDQIRREKEAQAAQAQEAEEIAQQQTDDTRRWSIPAHPPGLRGYGVVEEYFDMDDATLDERYPYKRKTTADESSPVMTPATKRRKVFEELENEDPRFKEPIAVDTAFDVERAEEDLEGTLRRPRNALRRHFERTTGKDLGDKHHQTKIQHHENSFSRSPLRDSQSSVNRRRSNDAQQSSPSTIYRGSTFAVPGDPGYKSNVFKSSDMQISAEQREQTSKREDRTKRSWWKKIPRADMKARAKEIVVSWNETGEISAEDKEYFEIAERRCGHIKGSGSFCSIDLETDDESDSETEADTDSSFEAEPVASTGPKQASPIMPVVPTPAATTPATPAAKKPLTGILKKPASAMVPPPTPKPANAQLPTPTAAPETPKAAVSQSPAKKQPDLSLHPSATPSKEQVNLDPDSALDRVRKQAEKHKPGRSTKMSQMMRVASSPLQPSSPVQTAGETENPSPVQSTGETENSMSKSLITQGTDLPAVQDDPASAFKHYQPFVPTSGSLPWSSPMASPGSPWSTTYGQATSKQPAETSRLAGNDRAAGENYKEVFRDIIEEAEGTSPTPSQKRKRFEEESDAKWSDNKKPKTLPITDKVDEQVYKARCDFLTARENRLTAACPSDALNSFISSKCRARYEANWHALLARKYATA